MTLKQATKKLQKLHPNRYQCVSQEVCTASSGERYNECALYLDPKIRVEAPTFEAAFVLLEKELK